MKIEDSELKRLAIAVRQEIESYVYEVPEHSLGSAWSGEKIYAAIAKMRACLVEPYWIKVDVSDTSKQVSGYVLKKATYAVIADDREAVVLVWDPVAHHYCLVQRAGGSASRFGVRGDGVGCFISR